MLKDGKMRPLKDTIAMCYLYSEAVNINQLFGLEAGGSWTYHAVKSDGTPQNIDDYVTESTSPTHAGAVVMNGKGIYKDNDIPYYDGVNTKIVKFTYKTDSGCLNEESYSIVIVLTDEL
jgi:hypothetical protein